MARFVFLMSAVLISSLFARASFAAPVLKTVDLSEQTVSFRKGDPEMEKVLKLIEGSMRPGDYVPRGPEKMPHTGFATMVVAKVKEAPDTLVVFFNYRKFMNAAFNRASIFNENIIQLAGKDAFFYEQRPVISARELVSGGSIDLVGGHDLTAQHLFDFWKALDSAPAKVARLPQGKKGEANLRLERQTREFLEPLLKKNPRLALVVIAADTDPSSLGSHELSHAQFFNNPLYRNAVYEFWHKHVPAEDKEKIRTALGETGVYNVEQNEDLAINEMQAYLTQMSASGFPLRDFLDPYFWLLRQHLMTTFPAAETIRFMNPHGMFQNPYCRSYLVVPAGATCSDLFAPSCH